MLQYVAVYFSVLQCVVDMIWHLRLVYRFVRCSVLQCVALCCSVLQYVAECCSVLQCVAVCCGYDMASTPGLPVYTLQCVAVYCSVLQCVAVCYSVLQCVAVYC